MSRKTSSSGHLALDISFLQEFPHLCHHHQLPSGHSPPPCLPSHPHLYGVPAVLLKLWLNDMNNSVSLLAPPLPASPLSPVSLCYQAFLLCSFVGVSVIKPLCFAPLSESLLPSLLTMCLCWRHFCAGNAVEWENEDKQHHSDAGLCHM